VLKLGYTNLQRLHRIMSHFPVPPRSFSSTDCDAHKHCVERNRGDRHKLVINQSSVISMTNDDGGITMSTTTYCPLFKRTKHISMEMSATQYIPESRSIRNRGTLLRFVMHILETLRSVFQMRYTSSPAFKRVHNIVLAHIKVCAPELSK
jgi:hypothetical protein